jgi:hypothetical protein
MLNYSINQPLTSLFDIAQNIQIESSFCIYHPNYQPFALPSKIADRFQQNSIDLQQKYLTITMAPCKILWQSILIVLIAHQSII